MQDVVEVATVLSTGEGTPGVAQGPESGPDVQGEVPLERLEARICSLAAKLASSTCEWLHMVAEFDRRKGWAQWGVRSCAHWLSWSCSVSPQAAREYLRVARELEKVPLIRAAFSAGRLSYSKVKAITRVVGLIAEQKLLDQALVHTAAQLERVVRAFRKTESAGLTQQQHRTARWFWDDDGMLVFTARLPPDEGGILLAAMRLAEDSLGVPVELTAHTSESAVPAPTDLPPVEAAAVEAGPNRAAREPRDSEQSGWSAADALMAMAQNSLAAGPIDSSGDDRHLLVLHVDAEVLGESSKPPEAEPDRHAGYSARRCQLEDGPGLDRATAERLICDAAVVAVVRSSLGPGQTGEPLRLGRKTRKVSPALRRALRIRDGGCQHPGCPRRRHLDAHHAVHWKDGGPTDLDNLLLLCRFHHMQVHEGGATVSFAGPVSQDATSGGWVFHRPDEVSIPAVRSLVSSPQHTDGERSEADTECDPELTHPGWRGERFSLAESVGVLCRAADDRAADDRGFIETDYPEILGRFSIDPEEAEFDDVVKINAFGGEGYLAPTGNADSAGPAPTRVEPSIDGIDPDTFDSFDDFMTFCKATLFPGWVPS